MKKANIWARFSPRPDESESEAIEKQLDRCDEYCAGKGYTVAKAYYSAQAVSGGDDPNNTDVAEYLDKLPELREAIKATRKRMVLVVRWRSRLARSVYIQEYIRRVIWKQGGDIEATDEPNGREPTDIFLQQMFAGQAEMERVTRNSATSRGMKRNQRAGRRMGRIDRCPFGWGPDPADDKLLVKLPDEQKTIAFIRARFAEGVKLRAICRLLDEFGFMRRGKGWAGAHSIIRSILER